MVNPSATVLQLGANQPSRQHGAGTHCSSAAQFHLNVSVIGYAALVVDLREERGVELDRSAIFRWVQKFGPEIARRTDRYLRRSCLDWLVVETCLQRLSGKA